MAPVQHLDGTPHFHLKPDTSQPLRLELLANFVEIAGKKVDKADDVKVGKMHCIKRLSVLGSAGKIGCCQHGTLERVSRLHQVKSSVLEDVHELFLWGFICPK